MFSNFVRESVVVIIVATLTTLSVVRLQQWESRSPVSWRRLAALTALQSAAVTAVLELTGVSQWACQSAGASARRATRPG